jgi:hypothetical protein
MAPSTNFIPSRMSRLSVIFLNHPYYYVVITIMGLTTNVSENNSSVEACVNITSGSVNSSDNYVYAYISTSPSTGFNSAVGKTILL